ncbi:metallophosphoesterase family protein [Enterovirga rhinocerotis]|uniref:DNA repair exonuclease SbcCD nuclease subunit n=1 Tax=Enterovirga rhinocerotis TaxID=1339210 RepID=A0A4R7C0D7_9HYPH|nr:DNA repair exonuclease [Enterovirga rhinocerotis]TDR89836.1 DNA repair exonuclease SbcCD nuclease subunit [Enterovirga rhinocerotis]
MASFTFLHAADLHLASPLAGLAAKDARLAELFAAASRDAFTALVDHALAEKVAFLLIAGDVFDGDWPDLSIGLFFARELARLDRAGIPVALVRGNHDAESVVRKAVPLPGNVLDFPSAKAATHRLAELGVALHGRSFADRAVPDESFARSYPEPVAGLFNIGLLHTSCAGYAEHATYAPCTPAELALRGYQYWALGHVHEHQRLWDDPPIVYPGNLQGRSIRECGPKGAVAVEVVDGRVAGLRHLVFDRARFAHLDLAAGDDEAALIGTIEERLRAETEQLGERPLAFRVTLRGPSALHERIAGDREQFAADLQAAAHRLHAEAWLEALRVRTTRLAAPAAGEAGLLDPAALMASLDHDPALREKAIDILRDVANRLPGGMTPTGEPDLAEDLDQLFAEAEALVMARLPGRGC